MEDKFACLKFIDKKKNIPIKFNIIKKNKKLFEWYINKFNPITIKDISILNAEGYDIILPIEKKEAENNKDKAFTIIKSAVEAIFNEDVKIIKLPDKFNFKFENIYIATGVTLFPFFILQAVNKSLDIFNKQIKNAEILIIDGNTNLSESIIDNIYNDINYLSVITDSKSKYFFEEKAKAIFDENGLNIYIFERNKHIAESADIIINTSKKDYKFDYIFKKNAIFFDLSLEQKRINELAGKRTDMLISNNFKLKYDKNNIEICDLELAMFCILKEYRNLIKNGHNMSFKNAIDKFLKDNKFKLSAFCLNKDVIHSSNFSNKNA